VDQRKYPRIEISYKLDDVEGDSSEIILRFGRNGGWTAVPDSEAAGDVGWPVAPGQHRIVWIAPADIGIDQIRLQIVADDRKQADPMELVSEVDSLRILSHLEALNGVREYQTNPDHVREVKDYIQGRFADWGLDSRRQEFMYGSTGYIAANLIGDNDGIGKPNNLILLTSHFDTVPGSPGADDNSSGTVGVLEAARVLSQYAFDRTIRGVTFDLEERGLVGSGYYVDNRSQDETIDGVINMDMIALKCDEINSQTIPPFIASMDDFRYFFPAAYDTLVQDDFRGDFIGVIADKNSHPLMDAIAEAGRNVPGLKMLTFPVLENYQKDFERSDHTPFWHHSIPAVMIHDGIIGGRNPNPLNPPFYHTPGDSLGTLDLGFLTQVVRAVTSAAAKLAGLRHAGLAVSDPFLPGFVDGLLVNGPPGNFNLESKYPKPFNAATRIGFTIPAPGDVSLDILDLSGRLMSRIMKNVQNPSRQVLEVDGSGWPSGVYLAVLRFGRMSATRKLVLVR
jgi:hypothetical protein